MKILVTGGTGFIGRHLCHRLVEDGHELVALIRSPKKANILPDGIELLEGDLSLFSDPELVLPECDTVVHLAAVVAGKNDAEYRKINHEAVVSFIECLERQSWTPKQFVFASSLAAAGPSPPDTILTEAMMPKPIDLYGEAKLKSEQYLRGENQVGERRRTIPTTSFRPAIVLGPLDGATFTLYKMAKLGVGFRPAGPEQPVSFIDVMIWWTQL
ncbi:MAG: NAD(P)-dependent oxidoreductase [Flavobacteriales bacterium]|nr:NAD(P)-dependent oxidoreductase [Flavobacteriales bacterium]